MKVIIDLDGNFLKNGAYPSDSFNDVADMAVGQSYAHSVEQGGFKLVTMIDTNEVPIGYCSFKAESEVDYRNNDIVRADFGIYYVYLREEYRGTGKSRRFADYMCNYLMCHCPNSTHYIDSSIYVSSQGEEFGMTVKDKLESNGLIQR